MSLTKIDCHFFVPPTIEEGKHSFVALNPAKRAGTLVLGAAIAQLDNLGSQVACKLATEHFVEGVLDSFETDQTQTQGREEGVLAVLQNSFKRANSSVYSFGHKLAAGGRMASALLGLVVHDEIVAAGRVGSVSAFLIRKRELFPFFEIKADNDASAPESEQLVGAHSMVAVEVASVPVMAEDCIVVMGFKDSRELREKLTALFPKEDDFGVEWGIKLFSALKESFETPSILSVITVGPQAIYLKAPII